MCLFEWGAEYTQQIKAIYRKTAGMQVLVGHPWVFISHSPKTNADI